MYLRFSILSTLILLINLCSLAQVPVKVKRKGVQPVNIIPPAVNSSLYSLEQFHGKWQEITRINRTDNSNIQFVDTLYFDFSDNNDVYIRDGINLSYKGKAELHAGNILSTGYDEFTIMFINKANAVLDDGDKYVHTIIKKKNFVYETWPADSISPEKLTVPVAVNYSDIMGKWSVYRRVARPGSIPVNEPVFTRIIIEDRNNSINGQVTFYNAERSETLSCTITLEGTKIHLVTLKHSWLMDIYKADKKELIFGSSELMYYCKPI